MLSFQSFSEFELQNVNVFQKIFFFVFFVITQGYAYDPDCMYINGSGRDYYEFYIQLNRCGTLGKNAISEKSRENPTVILIFQIAIVKIIFQVFTNLFVSRL